MPRARLSLSIPEGVWIHDVSTRHPQVTFEVVAALAGDEAAIGLVELRGTDPLPVMTDVERRSDVVEVDLLWSRETEALLQVETESQPLLVPAWRAGVPIEMPFTVRNGEATWTLTTSSARFSAFGEYLDESGIAYDVEYVHDVGRDEADRVMTDRQREVLLAAIEQGYYATPREATLTEVAEALDIAKATCSDVLHRAEGSLVTWFADEHLARGSV